jgi:hypothetical protein
VGRSGQGAKNQRRMMPMPLLTQNQSKPRSFIRQSSQPDLRSKNDSKRKNSLISMG